VQQEDVTERVNLSTQNKQLGSPAKGPVDKLCFYTKKGVENPRKSRVFRHLFRERLILCHLSTALKASEPYF
jgi:hypothetical protein